ncbi:ATP-binding protein [Pandoraea sputorum]|uniref:ATP-binding protein n=1 Tax=Pandoraea sputorum TaxID=93222 RepID=A0A5E5BKP9_9BURK|nr:ATP-binding protein [Pandoraea sputorum]
MLYVRVARLFEELKIAHGDGNFTRRLAQLAKSDVLMLDDGGLRDLDQGARNDLLEVLDDRVGTRSTIIPSQLPLEHWHAWLQDPTLADAILDRLVHQAHKLPLKGESLRKSSGKSPATPAS